MSILQQRSGLLNWGFGTAENVLGSVLESVRPAVRIVEGPLQRFDQFLCGGLDAVEQRVPSIYLPPRMVCFKFFEFSFIPIATYF